MSTRIGAVVLAAGKSSRMGEAKQLLRFGANTALERTLENIRAATVDEIVLVLGFSAEAIQRQLPAPLLNGLNIAINPQYEQGMASSLRAGLSALSSETAAALIVLADQPFIRPATIDRIIEQYRSTGAKIVIPFYKGQRGNPVLLDRSLFPEAMALKGDTGCRAIFPNHSDEILQADVDDPGILLDIDTPEDYECLRDLAE